MSSILALDIGERRIGVARASVVAKIAEPLTTLQNDSSFQDSLDKIIKAEAATVIVVGLPRGLNGQETDQTKYVRTFVESLSLPQIEFQDEAVTSVQAEAMLKSLKKEYSKEDIDAMAASLILQDYLEGQ